MISAIRPFGFHVDYIMMDGSAMNRQFTNLMFPESPMVDRFTTRNPYNLSQELVLIQDIKHVLKKFGMDFTPVVLKRMHLGNLNQGKYILWDHFVAAYEENKKRSLRLNTHYTRDHFYLNSLTKMRNHLAIEALNKDMVQMMEIYASTLRNPAEVSGTRELLQYTSKLVDIFNGITVPIATLSDTRLRSLQDIVNYFENWQKQYSEKKEVRLHLISPETCQDIFSSIIGFMKVCELAIPRGIPIKPTHMNSDLVELWFSCMRGIKNGNCTNPTLLQYSKTNNATMITGNIISSKVKCNAQRSTLESRAVYPPTKKFKNI